jgi:phospholipid/cholesterol/gamma-HCH transport system permease protein
VFNALDFGDLIPATIKVSFCFAIGLVGCFKGYYCKKGTAGWCMLILQWFIPPCPSLLLIYRCFVTDIFYDL